MFNLICRKKLLGNVIRPAPVAVRPKAKICGRSVAGIAGSNPVESMDERLFCFSPLEDPYRVHVCVCVCVRLCVRV